MVRAVIFGCAGTELSARESAFFRRTRPLGFILFQRNIESPAQVTRLIDDLKDTADGGHRPWILVDQEGGRVARFREPYWWRPPAAAAVGAAFSHRPETGLEAAYLVARLTADEMRTIGISVICAPVLDINYADGHEIIGDRAFGGTAEIVTALGAAACEGFRAGGICPVIKHIPGHGRAKVDSHLATPKIMATAEDLLASDCVPFTRLAGMPVAMTAHIIYVAWDENQVASTSRQVVEQVIRGAIGFQGLLLSDDISMQALTGSIAERAQACLAAGCDIVLHCNGDMGEMTAALKEIPEMSAVARDRVRAAETWFQPPEPFDRHAARARIDAVLNARVRRY